MHRLGGACDDAHELLTSTDAETIFIVLAQTLLPSFMCGVVVSGIFAASMSSSSSYLIIGASAMGENIFRGLLHRKATDKAGHDRGQGHAGGHVPVRHSGGIRPELVDLPGGVLRVGRAWCLIRPVDAVLAILASRQQGRRRGRHAVRHGGRADLAQPRQALGRVFAIYELLPAFIISLLFIVVVSLLTAKPNKRMLYEFDHYMDDPLPGTLPSGTVLVDEPMEAMESEVRSGK